MEMGQENTSKTKDSKEPIETMWIVTGSFTFSSTGEEVNQVKCSVVVKAEGAHSACAAAIDKMGARPRITRVQQMDEV